MEAFTAALFVLAGWRFGYGWPLAAALVFVAALVALTFIDFDTQLLPDDITLPLLWAGLVANLFGLFIDLRAAVLGAVAGYLILWSVYWAFKLVRGKAIMTSETVAKAGYAGLMRGKTVVIPGMSNKMMAQAVRFLPRNTVTNLVRSAQERAPH